MDIINTIIEYSTSFISTGGILFGFFIVFIECFIPILPLSVFVALNVNAFGFFIGILISWLATSLGSFLCYLLFTFIEEKVTEKILNKKGYNITIYKTEYKGHATEIIKSISHVDLVMSFGGDGTFNEVMTGNFQRKERLLLTHIPVGTTNDIGGMLGYTKNIIENVKLSLNGVVKKFDIGLINNHPFIYVAGFGKYMNISYETPRELKKQIGQFAYIKEGITTFFQKTKLFFKAFLSVA